MQPTWLTLPIVSGLYAAQAGQFGGAHGVRDQGLLENALERPRHLWSYGEDVTVFDLAAAYATGIISNHPFIDGNKRTGVLAAVVLLDFNGYRFEPPETEVVTVVLAAAAGDADERVLAAWFAEHAMEKL